MARTETGNVPKSYSLNMFKDFVPMCVFSETPQGEDPVCIYWMIFHIIFFWWKKFCDSFDWRVMIQTILEDLAGPLLVFVDVCIFNSLLFNSISIIICLLSPVIIDSSTILDMKIDVEHCNLQKYK